MLALRARIQTGWARISGIGTSGIFVSQKRKYTVNLSGTARRGLQEIYDYILSSTFHVTFSDSFIMELRWYIESLGDFPERFPVYAGNIRRVVYPKNTNYLIFFEINEDSAEVFVLDVVNASRYTRYRDLV